MDPASALVVVNGVGWGLAKLGGLGAAAASYVAPMMGFTTAGVLKGSLAAAAQSAIPNVAAGSVFAGMQSVGAAGAGAAAVVGVVPVAVTGAVAYGAYKTGAVGYVGRSVAGFVKNKIM